MEPAEWDAFVAAGNAALGRPAPPSTPLEERIEAAALAAQAEADTPNVDYLYAAQMEGHAEGLRAALAMVREQGATVPRAAPPPLTIVEKDAAVYRIRCAVPYGYPHSHTDLITDLANAIGAELDAVRAATLEAAGLWPVAAPGGER